MEEIKKLQQDIKRYKKLESKYSLLGTESIKKLKTICPHLETKKEVCYHEGDYYNTSHTEYKYFCMTCGTLTKTVDGGRGGYG
jgi:hypothetical protein